MKKKLTIEQINDILDQDQVKNNMKNPHVIRKIQRGITERERIRAER